MKNLFPLFIFFIFFVACKENFDELTDTDQRNISFEVSTEGFFDDFFDLPGLEPTYISSKYELDSGHKFRMSCYCYNDNDSLIASVFSLVNAPTQTTLKLPHLFKDKEYRFDIFADIVKYDKALDFYESWFHLETSTINSLYLLNMQTNEIPQHNILRHATITSKPENNTIPMKLEPITVNSYCILSNIGDTEWVRGEISYNTSFYIKSMSARSRQSYEFSYINKGEKRIIIPFTTPAIQDTVIIQIKRTLLNKTDEIEIPIINYNNQPFVADIDCKSLNLISCEFKQN